MRTPGKPNAEGREGPKEEESRKGTLGDRIGRRRLLLTGASAFAALAALVLLMRTAPEPSQKTGQEPIEQRAEQSAEQAEQAAPGPVTAAH